MEKKFFKESFVVYTFHLQWKTRLIEPKEVFKLTELQLGLVLQKKNIKLKKVFIKS